MHLFYQVLTIPSFNKLIVGVFTGPAKPVTLISLIMAIIVTLSTKEVYISDEEKMALVIAERGKKARA